MGAVGMKDEIKPVAWVERTEDGHDRMWSGDLAAWANRPADPEPLYDQATIDALLREMGELHWQVKRREEYAVECCASTLRANVENSVLREALTRARDLCGMGKTYDSGVAIELMQWIENGMEGPLPPLPAYLEGANA